MARPPPQSFLLRLWREQADAPLHATLIPVSEPQTPRHFATLDELCVFLQAQSGEAAAMIEHWGWQDCTPFEPR
jgi:hypothetical protein